MKFVLSGFGRMGKVHLEAARLIGWECGGIVDPSDSACVRASSEGIPVFSCIEEAVAATSSDALILSATADVRDRQLHWAIFQASLALTVSEKPLTRTPGLLKKIKNSDGLGGKLTVNHPMRFMPNWQHVLRLASSGRLGRPLSMNVSGANIGLSNNVVHFVEIASRIMNSSPELVEVWPDGPALPSPRGKEFLDFSGRLLVKFHNSSSLFIEFLRQAGHGIISVLTFENGKVVLDELSGAVRIIGREAPDFDEPTHRYGLSGWEQNHEFGAVDIVKTTSMLLRESQSGLTPADLQIAVESTSVVMAAHFLLEGERRTVSVDEYLTFGKDIPFPWS